MYCNNCGVELEENMSVCPLCKTHTDDKTMEINDFGQEKPEQEEMYTDYEKLTKKQRRKLFWELSGIILVSGIIVTFLIDLITNKNMTWSRYSITVLLVLFVNTTIVTFWRHRLILMFVSSFISTSVLLILFDMYNLNIGWAIKLGIPFLFSIYLISLILTLIIRVSKEYGLNLLGLFFLALGLLSVCIEGIISYYNTNGISLLWSKIVVVCIIPISAILYFIHYRLKKGIDLKRFFHI